MYFFKAIFMLVLELVPFPMLRAVVANSIDTADQGINYVLIELLKCHLLQLTTLVPEQPCFIVLY